eukprot:UN28356
MPKTELRVAKICSTLRQKVYKVYFNTHQMLITGK